MKLLIAVTLLATTVVADIDWSRVPPRHVDDRIRGSLGSIPAIEGRITNGEVAKPKQFPYQVGLMLHLPNGRAWCGGTLISNRWIVTAAHCTDGVDAVEVYLGATNRTDRSEVGQQNLFVRKKYIIVHEKWDSSQLVNDISVIKLPAPVEFDDYIRPAKLPKMGESAAYTGAKVIASGWGKDSDSARGASEILRWIEVPIMDNTVCNRYYQGSVKDTNICISTKGKKSTCNGDSGGPLVLADGSDTLIGATSFGIIFGCEVEFPGVFTRITSYLDWIKEKTGVANEYRLGHSTSEGVDDRVVVNPSGVAKGGRITHGEVAERKQFPHQVGLLLYLPNGKAWCGGTLISNQWIVSAAHCADGVESADVYLGATNRTDRSEEGQQILKVEKANIFVHEAWDPENLLNDISMLKLPSPVELNDYIKPANLPKDGDTATYEGAKVIASGWGRDSDRAQGASAMLRWIEVPVMPNKRCGRYYMGAIKDSHICIDTKGRKSTCNGDSGGPLILADGSNTLLGATSFGIVFGCEVQFPGVFTRITTYLEWIKGKMESS